MRIVDNVYIAEYGTTTVRMRNPFMSTPSTNVLVVAKDYNEAAIKAETYLEEVLKKEDKKNILDSDGSIKPTYIKEEEIKLVSLGLSEMKIIW